MTSRRYAAEVAASNNLTNARTVIELFEQAADSLRRAPHRAKSIVQLPARGRLLVTGDLHDNPYHFDKIMRLARLEQSDDHHVVLHEMIHGERLINGMDFSYRMLARIAECVVDRPGQVHPMLANHELAQLTGVAVSKGAGNSVALFNDALAYSFRDDWVEVSEAIKGFFRALPIAVRSEPANGGSVFCAHSLPNAGMLKAFDEGVFERDLVESDYRSPTGAAYMMTWGRSYDRAMIDALASSWGVKLFCLGHQHVETGIEMRGPHAVVLNSDHDRAMVLAVSLANIPDAEEAMIRAVPLAAVG